MRLAAPFAAALLAGAALAAPAAAQPSAEIARQLRDKALSSELAYEITRDLTTQVGPRPTGSPAMTRARDWAQERFKQLGFTNIRVEPFTRDAWTRGAESAEIVAPYPQKLSVLALGGSVPTPAGGLEAEVAVFDTLEALQAAPDSAVRGKIVLLTLPMPRTQDGTGYGFGVRPRRLGPGVAAGKGAVALLIRSVTPATDRQPHTGQTNYPAQGPRIPAAALSAADSAQLQRIAAEGKPIRLRLSLSSTTTPGAAAWNISGDIKGTSRPEEIIVIGGHLDSWDPGTGAVDDAAGIGITTAAAKLIAGAPRKPRRTIRVVMWGSEETGGSSEAYAAARREAGEMERVVLAGESDTGADRVFALRLPLGALKHPQFATIPQLMAPLSVIVESQGAANGGADIAGLADAGVPVLNLRQDASRYFDWHHTPEDTLDKIDPVQLRQNVAAWASVLWLAADSDIDFRGVAATTAPVPPVR